MNHIKLQTFEALNNKNFDTRNGTKDSYVESSLASANCSIVTLMEVIEPVFTEDYGFERSE